MAQENIVLIGNPFKKNASSDQLRTFLVSMRKIDPDCALFNVSLKRNDKNDIINKIIIEPHLTNQISNKINIFCIDVNKIEQTYSRLITQIPKTSYNIIVPFFEEPAILNNYRKQFSYFDEIWSYSKFHYRKLKESTDNLIIPLSCSSEIKIHHFLSRDYFNLPLNAFLFLTVFNSNESFERQNLLATLSSFTNLLKQFPNLNTKLIIKSNINKIYFFKKLSSLFKKNNFLKNKIIFVNKNLSINEEKNLLHHCDCFISLHRSICYGKYLAEAMWLEKPVIATNYSGNLDFMNGENSLLVDYQLIPINNSPDKMWADPNTEQTLEYMTRLISDRDYGREIGKRASYFMRQQFNYRAMGLKYFNRINMILFQKIKTF